MKTSKYLDLTHNIPYGKRVHQKLYVYRYGGPGAAHWLQDWMRELAHDYHISKTYNFVKFDMKEPRVSFLDYPFSPLFNRHPSLQRSAFIDLQLNGVDRYDYRSMDNPPILHRVEEMLPDGHKWIPELRKHTQEEEAAGLYKDTSKIGNLLGWTQVIACCPTPMKFLQ